MHGFTFSVKIPCIHLTVHFKINGSYRLNLHSNLSDRLETFSGVFKRRNCRYLSALHPGTHAVLLHTINISNGLSRTLEVYGKVLHVLDCILEGALCTFMH